MGRVSFDFSVDGGREALKSIECLLQSGHWSDRALNFEDEWTMFLLKLLRPELLAEYPYAHLVKVMFTK